MGRARSLALELASRGMTVNVVAPGLIESPAIRQTFKPEQIESLVPMKRVGTPEEVAALVSFSGLGTGRIHYRPGHRRQRRHGMNQPPAAAHSYLGRHSGLQRGSDGA